MSDFTKRDATPEEEGIANKIYAAMNPDTDYAPRLDEAKAQGHKCEVCSCGRILPAFVHFVRCRVDGCPMRSKSEPRSLLAMICDVPAGDPS